MFPRLTPGCYRTTASFLTPGTGLFRVSEWYQPACYPTLSPGPPAVEGGSTSSEGIHISRKTRLYCNPSEREWCLCATRIQHSPVVGGKIQVGRGPKTVVRDEPSFDAPTVLLTRICLPKLCSHIHVPSCLSRRSRARPLLVSGLISRSYRDHSHWHFLLNFASD